MSELKGVTDDIVGTARDAAYVAVGLGVLAVQRAQVRRSELIKALAGPREDLIKALTNPASELSKLLAGPRDEVRKVLSGFSKSDLDERLSGLREDIGRGVKFIDGHVEQLIETLESSVGTVEERLPEPARDIVKQARTQARDVRQQIRHFLAAA
jgi:hypothetical protein